MPDTQKNQESNHQLHVFVDASTVALAAVAYIRTQKKAFKRLFFLENSKLHQLNKFNVPKLELKAAGLGTHLLTRNGIKN